MERRTLDFDTSDSPIRLILERSGASSTAILVGTAQLQAGQRIPHEGESAHPADEYSLVLRGRARVTVGGKDVDCGPGTLLMIPAGEGHVTAGLEDTEVLWWWAGQPADFDDLKAQYPGLPTS
ncbi:hypothetical protein GCM10022631_26870 [Deinococcus rubellus]|uniref:cupin domain-containing protein n=1 Tax=Deinococcus rubellus TaxID=1889240 RepID=UPI0031E65354